MAVEIVTKEELQALRFQIVNDIKELLDRGVKANEDEMRGYRSKDVRNMLGCSAGKLKALRESGRIRVKKIGGTIYYSKEDIRRLLTAGF
jgi:hypothetical protein